MAKFKIEIIRTDEYEVEIDESVWTPEGIAKWSTSFYEASEAEDIAIHLAKKVMRFGSNEELEGFGLVKMLRADGKPKFYYSSDDELELAPGLTVKVISEDEAYEHTATAIR